MPSNTTLNTGTGGDAMVTKRITHDGDLAKLQGVSLLIVTGTEDAYTAVDLTGDATFGLDVDVTRLPTVTVAAHAVTNAGTFAVQPGPSTSGGCSTRHLVSAATTNATNIKASAGQVYGITVFNNAAYPIYIKFHDTAGTPTPGAAVYRAFGVQAGTQAIYSIAVGMAFATGIAISIVKGITDADATAVALSDCVLDVEFK